jgi:hypothetical protein
MVFFILPWSLVCSAFKNFPFFYLEEGWGSRDFSFIIFLDFYSSSLEMNGENS